VSFGYNIKGVCLVPGVSPGDVHVVTTAIEHPATARPVEWLGRLGARVTVVPADRFGLIDPDAVRAALTPRTRLVSVMHSNNEVGTLLPVREVAAVCRARGVLVHTDCAQSPGKVPVNVNELGVDLLTVAGHKLYAPKGVGALYVRRGVRLEPLVHGAGPARRTCRTSSAWGRRPKSRRGRCRPRPTGCARSATACTRPWRARWAGGWC
jgi:cysteine sulfinate desulfinase/cysteine desulfurase-like protein